METPNNFIELISTFRLIYSHHQDNYEFGQTLILRHNEIIWTFHYFVPNFFNCYRFGNN